MKYFISSFLLLCLSFNLFAQSTCFTIKDNPDISIDGFDVFSKYLEVFGIKLYATEEVSNEDFLHAAGVMAEYLDNNENNVADNPLLINEMIDNEAFMVIFEKDGTNNQNKFFRNYNGDGISQDLYGSEIHPNGSSDQNGFDATLEEILHLISHAGYASLYPNIFGEKAGTKLALAMDLARGGYFENIPSSYPEEGWYHYDDETCEYDCMITEYFYWGLTTLLGAQDYENRCNEIKHEWELCNAQDLINTDTSLYQLLTDSNCHIATKIPKGNYCPEGMSIDDTENSRLFINIYPNPSTNEINIQLLPAREIKTIIIQNTFGQVVLHKSNLESDKLKTQLSAGVYFIRINNEVNLKKVIIL